MTGEGGDAVDVGLDGAGREVPEAHVLDHAAAERGHVRLLWRLKGSRSDGPVHDAATERRRDLTRPREVAAGAPPGGDASEGPGEAGGEEVLPLGIEKELGFAYREAV
jgi:hypothetical protein